MVQPLSCKHSLEANHAQLYEILVSELVDFVVFLVDLDGCILSWNLGVERILGYTEEEWIGRPSEITFTLEDRSQNQPQKEMEKAACEGRAADRRWHLHKNGSRLYVESTLVALHNENGQLLGFSKVMRDITKRKERESEQLTRELQRSNEDLTKFAYLAAHDLQSPLRGVTSFAQLLRRRAGSKLNEEENEFVDHILDTSHRMGELVQTLLQWAQVGQGSIQKKPVPMESVLDEALGNLRSQIEEQQATITRSPLPIVPGDSVQLVQLVGNLIGNALKYSRADQPPRIAISAEPQGSDWVFRVKDNGEGIAPEHQEQIFEPLKRLHGADVPGTGLGLTICRRIVEHHGGRIRVESQEGEGSTFFFTLPATGGNASPISSSEHGYAR